MQSDADVVTPNTAPPSLSAHESLWTEMLYYTVFQFTATFVIFTLMAVNKQWHYIGVCLHIKSFLCMSLVSILETKQRSKS
jgi:hypothetical protein